MIYLDHNATTPLDPQVLEAMLPYLTHEFGNPASETHLYGQRAKAAVEEARAQVATLIGAEPRDILFTSGATESDNLAVIGVARALRDRGRHLITGATEHKAVLEACQALEQEGFEVTYLPVDRHGQVHPQQVAEALLPQTLLVSLMLANSEIGTLHPIAAIAAVCHQRGVLLHTDAAQAAGKIPIQVEELGADLLSLSAHKLYGPKGAGALYVRSRGRPRVRLQPILHGGGHERGLRSGTLNVPAIVGFGRACSIAAQVLPEEMERCRQLRDRLWEQISAKLAGVHPNGHPVDRHPGMINFSIEAVDAQALLAGMQEVALSAGSACTSASGETEGSYVLRALGLTEAQARSTVRACVGRFNTEAEIDRAAEVIAARVRSLREMGSATSPLQQ